MTSSTIISAIVTFHSEGEIAQRTLQCIENVRRFTEKNSISVEIVCVLDCANQETISAVASSPFIRSKDQVIQVKNGDLGASRNSGIKVAKGGFIGIFDGDDYYTENWLLEAHRLASTDPEIYVVHPELQVSFGSVHCVAHILDMNKTPNYPMQNCLSVHPWIACSFAAKSIYENNLYCRTDTKDTGFGFEDWHWNLETISKGARHVSAPNTAHYYRRKPTSMLTEMVALGAVIPPTDFFNYPERWGTALKNNEVIEQVKSDKVSNLLPDWAIAGLNQISEIESDLQPTEEFLNQFTIYNPPFDLAPGNLYAQVLHTFEKFKPDVICFVISNIWCDDTDAKWQDSFAKHVDGKKVLIVFTEHFDSKVDNQTPVRFNTLNFCGFANAYSETEKIKVLTRVICQLPVNDIYIVKSTTGLEMVKRHYKSFKAINKNIFVSVDGKRINSESNFPEEFFYSNITEWLNQYSESEKNTKKMDVTKKKHFRNTNRQNQIVKESQSGRILQKIKKILLGKYL